MTKIESTNPIVNPMIVFREEFDDWAVLFDPDSGETYGLDPVSAFIWKQLDGTNTQEEILKKLDTECEDGIPEDAPQHVGDFIKDLTNRGLVGTEQ